MAFRDGPMIPRLQLLGRLTICGRFDEIGRRLMGRHRRDPVVQQFCDPPEPQATGGPAAPPPWRIAAFIHESGLSGAPLSLLDLATALTERKLAEVQVLAPDEGPITAACRAAGLDVAIHGVELRRILTLRHWNKAVTHLASLMRAFAPNIVHANTIMAAPALPAARTLGIPTLLNVREDGPDDSLFDFLPRDIAIEAFRSLRAASEVVFVSQASHVGWCRYFVGNAISTIPNALRSEASPASERTLVRARLGMDEATVLVLCVGSYCERKGQIDLIEAIARLPHGLRSRVHVAMAGEAEPFYLAKLRHRIARLDADLHKAFSLLPAQARPAALYGAADIFVCCSRRESFPRVTIEAMRVGLPIVTTPVAGIVEQLNPDEALFYPPQKPEALAEQIAHLVTHPGDRAEFGRRALFASARHSDFGGMVDRYVEAYRRALQRQLVPAGQSKVTK